MTLLEEKTAEYVVEEEEEEEMMEGNREENAENHRINDLVQALRQEISNLL